MSGLKSGSLNLARVSAQLPSDMSERVQLQQQYLIIPALCFRRQAKTWQAPRLDWVSE